MKNADADLNDRSEAESVLFINILEDLVDELGRPDRNAFQIQIFRELL